MWYPGRHTQLCILAKLAAMNVALYEIGLNMSTQDDVTAIQAKVDAFAATVITATTGIRDDIAEVKAELAAAIAANPALDLTALSASVDTLGTSVAGLSSLDAENPVPPVA
jgi:hypothetical protein